MFEENTMLKRYDDATGDQIDNSDDEWFQLSCRAGGDPHGKWVTKADSADAGWIVDQARILLTENGWREVQIRRYGTAVPGRAGEWAVNEPLELVSRTNPQ
jgi:hypothetical protein